MRWVFVTTAVWLLAGCASDTPAGAPGLGWVCENTSDRPQWHWNDARDSLAECVSAASAGSGYEIALSNPHLHRTRLLDISDRSGGAGAQMRVHDGTSFQIVGDTLYWVDFNAGVPYVAGFAEAVDLRTGNALWRTSLAENRAINNSLWRTEVWLAVEGDKLAVYVKEHGEASAAILFHAGSGRRLQHCYR